MRAIIYVLSLVGLSGCELHQVKGEVGGVELEARTKQGNGDFCPPGQAKKGKCRNRQPDSMAFTASTAGVQPAPIVPVLTAKRFPSV